MTLIFYRINKRWWTEPILNIIAAVAQNSAFTHVELAIGSDATTDGAMTNVVRVFNDNVGAFASCKLQTHSRSYAFFTRSPPVRRCRGLQSNGSQPILHIRPTWLYQGRGARHATLRANVHRQTL